MFGPLINNKVANNAIWIIIGKIAQSVIALIINLLTARFLGPSNFGVISYAASIVAFVVPIMNLGFSNVLVQEITNYPEEEGEILGSSIALSIISAVACIIGVSVYTFAVDVGEKTTNIVVILYSILLVFQAFELIQYWFQAKLLSKYMSIVSLIAYVIVASYKVLLLVLKASVEFFAVSNALDYFLIAVLLYIVYKKLGGSNLKFSSTVAKRMFSSSKHYIITSLMVTIFMQTDRIMIKLMIGEAQVGYYSAATSIATMSSFVFLAIIDSMRPAIFQCKKENDNKKYEKNIARTYCMIIYLALVQCILITLFSGILVKILYGQQYLPSSNVLKIVVWFTTFSYIGAVRNIWILGEGKQKYLWCLNTIGASMNVALNLLLIPYWGMAGAAIASVITQFVTNVVLNLIIKPLRYNNTLMMKGLNPNLIFDLIRSRSSKR